MRFTHFDPERLARLPASANGHTAVGPEFAPSDHRRSEPLPAANWVATSVLYGAPAVTYWTDTLRFGYTRLKFEIRMSIPGLYCAFMTMEIVPACARFGAATAFATSDVATRATKAQSPSVKVLRLLKLTPPSHKAQYRAARDPNTALQPIARTVMQTSANRTSERGAGLEFEELELVHVDAEVDRRAGRNRVVGLDATDDLRLSIAGRQVGRRSRVDVTRDLEHVVGHDGWGGDRAVDQPLGSERLAEQNLHPQRRPPVVGVPLEVLGTDPDRDIRVAFRSEGRAPR